MKEIHGGKKPVLAFLKRFHLVIFIASTMLILSIAITLLSGVVGRASGENSTPPSNTSFNFDQSTIESIKKLKTSDQPSDPLDLSQGRINPFGE